MKVKQSTIEALNWIRRIEYRVQNDWSLTGLDRWDTLTYISKLRALVIADHLKHSSRISKLV